MFWKVGIYKTSFQDGTRCRRPLCFDRNRKSGTPMLYSSLALVHLSYFWLNNIFPKLLVLSIDQRSKNEKPVLYRWPNLFPSFPFSNLTNTLHTKDNLWGKITRSQQACTQWAMVMTLTPISMINWDYFPFSLQKISQLSRIFGDSLGGHWLHHLPRLPTFWSKVVLQPLLLGHWFLRMNSRTWVQ